MYTIIFHPEAVHEFSEALLWYEDKKEGLSNRFFLSVEATIKLLQSRPETFGYSRKPFREASVTFFPYVIMYKVYKRKKQIFVSSIFHTSRNPAKKFRK
jgi:hypothetical protein